MNYEVMIHTQRAHKDGDIHPAYRPFEDAAFLRVDIACPHCNTHPLQVKRVSEIETHGRSEYVACACDSCFKHVGTAKYTSTTLFGREEDIRVLEGRMRVY